MEKIIKKPSPTLFPVPTVLVTCFLEGYTPNIITIAWTGILNSEPPIIYISVNPNRHSYKMIKESGEYVINIPTSSQANIVDFCGVNSGRNIDKFSATDLTPAPSTYVKPPLIAECPVNLECKIRNSIFLGSHEAFIAEILAIHYNSDVLDSNGQPNLDKIKPYGYCLKEYRSISKTLGSYGYSKSIK